MQEGLRRLATLGATVARVGSVERTPADRLYQSTGHVESDAGTAAEAVLSPARFQSLPNAPQALACFRGGILEATSGLINDMGQ